MIPPLRIFGVVAKERGLERQRHNRSSIGATRISSLKSLPSQSHSLPPDPVFPSRLRIGSERERERKSLRVHFGQSSPFTDCLACQVGRSLFPAPSNAPHPPSLPSLECRAGERATILRPSVRPFAKVGGHIRGGQLPRGGGIGPRLRENAPRPCCVAANRQTDGICPPTSIHFDHPSLPRRPPDPDSPRQEGTRSEEGGNARRALTTSNPRGHLLPHPSQS